MRCGRNLPTLMPASTPTHAQPATLVGRMQASGEPGLRKLGAAEQAPACCLPGPWGPKTCSSFFSSPSLPAPPPHTSRQLQAASGSFSQVSRLGAGVVAVPLCLRFAPSLKPSYQSSTPPFAFSFKLQEVWATPTVNKGKRFLYLQPLLC